MLPHRRSVDLVRQRETRIDANTGISRLNVFLYEKLQREVWNLHAIEGNGVHVNESLMACPVRMGDDYDVVYAAKNT